MHRKGPSISKGLDTLLQISQKPSNPEVTIDNNIQQIAVDQITPGRFQPRRHFDEIKLKELAQSIASQGLIQPILVRESGGKYEIIAGERRWRASILCNLQTIPAIVKNVDDNTFAAFSLVENIQREDLNPIEEAKALESLYKQFHLTHDEIGKRIGKPRTVITNTLRLLNLEQNIQQYLIDNKIEVGHAKILSSLNTELQVSVVNAIINNNLTVRETEKYLKARKGKSQPTEKHGLCNELSQKLSTKFGIKAKVDINKNGKGKITLQITTILDIERILEIE